MRNRVGWRGLTVVATMLVMGACKPPCEKLVEALCETDPDQCKMAMEPAARKEIASASPERQRECRVQLEELDSLPRPHTRRHFSEASDRAAWRTKAHPEPRVAGLPPGYAWLDWVWQDVFSSVLVAAAERQLTEAAGDSYRFVWAPSLRGTAFVVRASRADGGTCVEWKRLDQPGEAPYFRPSQVALSKKRDLSAAEWSELAQRVLLARTLPSRSERAGEDGSMWLLESVVDGGYTMSLRWSPEEDTDPLFRAAVLTLVSLGTPDGGYDDLDL